MEPVICKKHNVEKKVMRNGRSAPFVGCPMCHPPKESKQAPPVDETPKTERKPEVRKRSFNTFFHRRKEA